MWASKRGAQHVPGPRLWCILARGPLGAGLKDFHLPLQDHGPGSPPPSSLYPRGSGGHNHGAMTTDQLQVPWPQTHRGKSKAQIAESLRGGGISHMDTMRVLKGDDNWLLVTYLLDTQHGTRRLAGPAHQAVEQNSQWHQY